MLSDYNDQLHDFIYQSMSDGIPPLFFWTIFGIIAVVLIILIYKVSMKIYYRQKIRLVIYSLLTLIIAPVFIYASFMVLTAHHIENNQDVSKHHQIIKDIDVNDEGGYTLELDSGKHIKVKNIVDTNDKSLKNESNPMTRGDKITYYQSESPNVILKAVIDPQSYEDESKSGQKL